MINLGDAMPVDDACQGAGIERVEDFGGAVVALERTEVGGHYLLVSEYISQCLAQNRTYLASGADNENFILFH
jgi:hypothetical protein